MKFRTELQVAPQDNSIGYNSKIFLLGSCFVENIGEKLDYFKFQNYKNPFGILYHPAALENFLRKAIKHIYILKPIFFIITNAGIALMRILTLVMLIAIF